MKRNNLFSSLTGQVVEWYDFTIYGFLANIMAVNFFPNKDFLLSLMASFAVFTIGFIARPIGSIIFGNYGDQIGRKEAFKLSILLMGLPTLLIALLPTYRTLSIFSPTILIALRIAQGLACGGEFIGSIIFLGEHSPKSQQAYWCGFTWFGSLLGTLLGLVTCLLLNTLLSNQQMNDWGWRIAFLSSSIGLVTAIWFRNHAEETPVFLNLEPHQKHSTPSLISIVKEYGDRMFVISVVSVQIAVISYLFIIYLPSYLHVFLGYSNSFTFFLGIFNIVALIIMLPTTGKLLDKFVTKFPTLLSSFIPFF